MLKTLREDLVASASELLCFVRGAVGLGKQEVGRLVSGARDRDADAGTDARLAGSQTTAYTYDEANNLAGVTYPNGVAAQFAYDSLNRVSGLASQLAEYTCPRDGG